MMATTRHHTCSGFRQVKWTTFISCCFLLSASTQSRIISGNMSTNQNITISKSWELESQLAHTLSPILINNTFWRCFVFVLWNRSNLKTSNKQSLNVVSCTLLVYVGNCKKRRSMDIFASRTHVKQSIPSKPTATWDMSLLSNLWAGIYPTCPFSLPGRNNLLHLKR